MILGVVYGTLSSLFLAAPLAYLTMGRSIKNDEDTTAEAAADVVPATAKGK
jgi:SecD/SecF fusion protein